MGGTDNGQWLCGGNSERQQLGGGGTDSGAMLGGGNSERQWNDWSGAMVVLGVGCGSSR